MFPLWHIALSAGIGALATFLLLLIARSFSNREPLGEMIGLAVVVGVSILVWRAAGNTAALNLDPIPAISPNDVLCPDDLSCLFILVVFSFSSVFI